VPEENAVFVATSGRDLAAFADAAFDLVLAVDSFPYLVSAGPDVVRRHVEEAARVLRPGGALLLLNFSYRGDAAADMEEVAALAARFGLGLIRSGEAGFATWDARVFELRKPLRPAPPRSP
jgi:SAM-dependent methyltransferase